MGPVTFDGCPHVALHAVDEDGSLAETGEGALTFGKGGGDRRLEGVGYVALILVDVSLRGG
jgi:hypothetical protein